MGPVRHRRLINWLSMAVALQMSVALVALAARAGRDIGPQARTGFVADGAQNGSILAGTAIAKRRGAGAEAGGLPFGGLGTGDVPPAPPAESPTTTAAAATSPAATGDQGRPGTLADPAGDTVADGSGRPLSDPRGDIVRAGAVYGPAGVTFALQVQRPADPRADERWAAASTYAQWEVDTNGDALPDFEVQYFFVDADNLGGSVSKPGDGGAPLCAVNSGTYSDDGYKLTVDPACLGDPASVAYRASLYYDTNPTDENAEVVTDTAPNGGWSTPIARP